MNIRWVGYLCAAWSLGSARPGMAQTRAPHDWAAATNESSARDATLSKPVTLRLQHVSLKRALDAIGSTAAVRIQYRAEVVNAVTTPVSLSATAMPLGAALDRILAGTGLQAMSSVQNVVTIAVREDEPQATGTIVGKVIHAKTKQPVAGVTVTLDAATQGVITGQDGAYRLTVDAGDHSLHVRGLGFVKQSKTVTIEASQTVTRDILLEPSASVLDEVVVTGAVTATERKAITTPITVITGEELERRNITNVEQLFRGEIPGVIAMDQGTNTFTNRSVGGMATSQVFARGASGLNGQSTPLKTYVDGVELLNSSYLGTIDPKSIERIEVITGPQAATVYGSGALGGVMQIFTKKGRGGRGVEATLTARYGILQNNLTSSRAPMHNDMLTITGGSGPEFSYSSTLSHAYTGQWQPDLFARTLGLSVGATHTNGGLIVSGSLSLTGGKNGTWGGNGPLYTVRERTGEWSASSVKDFTSSQMVSTSTGQTFSLDVDYRVLPAWQHHLTGGRNQTNFALVPTAPVFSTPSDSLFSSQQSNGYRNTLSYNTTIAPTMSGILSSTLTLGMTGSWGDQANLTGCLNSPTSTAYVPCSSSSTVDATKVILEHGWGGFASARIGFFDKLFLTAGLRGERSPLYGSAHKIDWTPTNGLAYTTSMGDLTLKLLGSYGRATRAPTNNERESFYWNVTGYTPSLVEYQRGNPDLLPQTSRGPQGGLELYWGNLASLTVNHYRQRVSQLMENFPVDSILLVEISTGNQYYNLINQYQNTSDVLQKGWEGTASVNAGPVLLKGTYSWNDSRILKTSAYTAAFRTSNTFNNVPTHSGSFTVGYALGATSANLVTNWMGRYPRTGFLIPGFADLYASTTRRERMYGVIGRQIFLNYVKVAPSYTKSNLDLSHRLNPWASLTLNVTNLFDQYGSDTNWYTPTLGRQSMFGVSLKFPKR